MKDIIESMFMLPTDDVLDRFYSLPGAQSGNNYVFIPGDRENPILLVGHADTVFANPPKRIEWKGNWAKAGFGEPPKGLPTLIPKGGLRSRFAPEEPTPVTPETAKAAVEMIDQLGTSKKEASELKRACTVTLNGEVMTLDEFEEKLQKGEIKTKIYRGNTTSTSTQLNLRHNGKRRATYPPGLGADDRAGCAMIWTLRNLGHSILICDLEEIGGVGAREAGEALADVIAQHQFAVEIDRMGDQEMVFYDVSTPEFEQYMVEQTGFSIGIGSYTDVKDVARAGNICGVNLAAGYLFQHSEKEMFFYDFWLRTQRILHRMLTQKEAHPRFELPPKKQPAKSQGSSASAGTAGGTAGIDDADYQEYLDWRYGQASKGKKAPAGPLDLRTPLSQLHEVQIDMGFEGVEETADRPGAAVVH